MNKLLQSVVKGIFSFFKMNFIKIRNLYCKVNHQQSEKMGLTWQPNSWKLCVSNAGGMDLIPVLVRELRSHMSPQNTRSHM